MKATQGGRRNAQRRRINDPEGTRRNIVEVATHEFAQKGFSGARVDAIANRTRTSKRMIYYYFGSKEGLYLAVLEEAYCRHPPRRSNARSRDAAAREGAAAPSSASPSTTTTSTPSSCAWS